MKVCILFFFLSMTLPDNAQVSSSIELRGKDGHLKQKKITISNSKGHYQTIALDKFGSWSLTVPNIPEGYYLLANRQIFLAPGYHLYFNTLQDSLVSGVGGKENNILYKNDLLANKLFPIIENDFSTEISGMNPDLFINRLQEYRNRAMSLLSGVAENKFFYSTQVQAVDAKTRLYSEKFKIRYGINRKSLDSLLAKFSNDPQKNRLLSNDLIHIQSKRLTETQRNILDSITWYQFNLNNDALYDFSAAYKILLDLKIASIRQAQLKNQPRNIKDNSAWHFLQIAEDSIKSPRIRREFISKYTRILLTSNEPADFKEKCFNHYMSIETDPVFLKRMSDFYYGIKNYGTGSLAPDFTYRDNNAKLISLHDLKGFYVYIDIWATWCLPCIQEIPSLQKLQQELDSSHIKFVSISIDKINDKVKWLQFIKNRKLTGIQVMADNDWNSDLIKKINVTSIPRFVLVDPLGQIISPYALRPSDKKLGSLLTQLIINKN